MRAMSTLVSPLAAAMLVTTAARPAAGQDAAAVPVRPAVSHEAVVSATAPRPVAVYRLAAARETGLPQRVTIADSAGVLVASFRFPGDGAERPMWVDVVDTDIVLQGVTTAGVLTLVLHGQNGAEPAGTLVGHWQLGQRRGELRGRVTR